jgi:hypothetical protein
MRGAQSVSQHERLKIHRYFSTVKLYTLVEWHGTDHTRVTGLQSLFYLYICFFQGS